ncbi:MAG: hypothetical protein PHG08_00605 [Bacilli bacterium]|nr:hypothetical protein [Bacilli bacterium]
MNEIERSCYLRERIRENFSGNERFNIIFEHLKNGYCSVYVQEGEKHAKIIFHSGESDNQLDTIEYVVMSKLVEKLNKPYDIFQECFSTFETIPKTLLKTEVLRNNNVDVEKFKSFRELFDSQYTDEENIQAKNEIKFTLANRQWLRDNKKGFTNSNQAKRFHELAYKVRLSSPKNLDDELLKAFLEATLE